eukprot:gene11093-7720_t
MRFCRTTACSASQVLRSSYIPDARWVHNNSAEKHEKTIFSTEDPVLMLREARDRSLREAKINPPPLPPQKSGKTIFFEKGLEKKNKKESNPFIEKLSVVEERNLASTTSSSFTFSREERQRRKEEGIEKERSKLLVFRDVGMDLDKPILSRDVFLVFKYLKLGKEFAIDNELERMLRYFNEHAVNELKIIHQSKLMRGPETLFAKGTKSSLLGSFAKKTKKDSASGNCSTQFPSVKCANVAQFCPPPSANSAARIGELIPSTSFFKRFINGGAKGSEVPSYDRRNNSLFSTISPLCFSRPAVVIFSQLGQKFGGEADAAWRKLAFQTICPTLNFSDAEEGILSVAGRGKIQLPMDVISFRSSDLHRFQWVQKMYITRFIKSLSAKDTFNDHLLASTTFVGSKLLAPFYSSLGLRNYLSPYAMLVDATGNVRWMSSGCPDAWEERVFPSLLKQLEAEFYQKNESLRLKQVCCSDPTFSLYGQTTTQYGVGAVRVPDSQLRMSAVHRFFSQRQEDKKSSKSVEQTLAAVFGKAEKHADPGAGAFHVAIQGCCHGELNKIYDGCRAHEANTGRRIDFLICCGDFQSMRFPKDLQSMAAPQKYLRVGDFHEYWSPDPLHQPPMRTAPYLTIFVGGNHESSDWLAEESYGGFLAPNIYYLGHSGVIVVDDQVCIAGLSGIFKGMDYLRPFPPRPYTAQENFKRSAYHIRRVEMSKLHGFCRALCHEPEAQSASLSSPAAPRIQLFLSHDWPAGITKYGNEEQLLQQKPFFRDEVAHSALGNPHTMELLRSAQPEYWLAAHLHCYFTAKVPHPKKQGPRPSETPSPPTTTTFMALDKCSKHSGFLDFIDLKSVRKKETAPISVPANVGEVTGAGRIRRHPLWLRALAATHGCVAANDYHRAENILSHDKWRSATLRNESAAAAATTTSALLGALGLPPLSPLHLGVVAAPSPLQAQVQAPLPPAAGPSDSEELGWSEDLNPLGNPNPNKTNSSLFFFFSSHAKGWLEGECSCSPECCRERCGSQVGWYQTNNASFTSLIYFCVLSSSLPPIVDVFAIYPPLSVR